jgi:SAM-dependent methyltransferase
MDYFARGSFDMVYSSNALDHVMSPQKCLENIGLVIRRDGIVCLEGFCREGTNAQWVGLHQHDLVPDKGHLLHFDRRGKRTNLTENLKLNCVYQKIGPFHERGIEAFGYEPEEAEVISDWHYRDWYTMIFSLEH